MQKTFNSNDDITIVWKPYICHHFKTCWKGLLEVFDPRAKPWIKMDGAITERIIEQVKKCPGVVLSYCMNEEITTAEPE